MSKQDLLPGAELPLEKWPSEARICYFIKKLGEHLTDGKTKTGNWWSRYEEISGMMGSGCILSFKTAANVIKSDELHDIEYYVVSLFGEFKRMNNGKTRRERE
jgi:hypothetical protein